MGLRTGPLKPIVLRSEKNVVKNDRRPKHGSLKPIAQRPAKLDGEISIVKRS